MARGSVTIVGTEAQVNAALAGLTYTGSQKISTVRTP